IGISLILMSSVLPLSQSLTGYLSLFLIVIAFFVFSKNNRKEITFLFLFVIIGLVIGYGIKIGLNISDVSETKLQTSHIRWVLWQHSLYLFSDHFFLGTGIGSFESVFLETYGGELMGIGRKTMSHPHNEILRWMVEGGIIGLIGIL
ncbi:O-antigen ligase family protein, partial [Providencia heimbachae]